MHDTDVPWRTRELMERLAFDDAVLTLVETATTACRGRRILDA